MALITGMVLFTSPSADARLYKWVDSEGNIIYSQTPPPKEAQSGHVELNRRGLKLREVDAPLTDAEREEREEQDRERAKTAALLELKAQRDDRLLKTFPSLNALDQARDYRLETLDQKLRYLESRVNDCTDKLELNGDRVANFRRKNLAVPQQLVVEKAALDLELADLMSRVDSAQAERDGVSASYAADRERYIELSASRKRVASGS